MATTGATEQKFFDAVDTAYGETLLAFAKFSTIANYKPFVLPPATNGKPGFAIFYTLPRWRPDLLIVGQNPGNFAGGTDLMAPPNATMLAGYPPQHNSYTDDRHNFGHALQGIFTGRESLLANAVGMNVWFCQMAGSRFSGLLPPPDIRNYCSSVTRTLIAAMEPRAILCVSSAAFLALRQPAPRAKRIPEYPVAGAIAARYSDLGSARVWYIHHPTGSHDRAARAHDPPIVVAELEAYFAARDLA